MGFFHRVIYFRYNFTLINKGFCGDPEGVRTSRKSVVWLRENCKPVCACERIFLREERKAGYIFFDCEHTADALNKGTEEYFES